MASKVRRPHLIVDHSADEHDGANLVTLRCFCGAERGVDYERYPFHLQQHSPEDLGLGGDHGAE